MFTLKSNSTKNISLISFLLMLAFTLPILSSCSKHKEKKQENVSIIREGTIDVYSIDANKDGFVYQDMMDWNVISDEPGNCPVCGMKLKKVTIKKAEKNLISHNFKIKKEKATSIIRKGLIDLKSIDSNKDGFVYQDMMDWNVISDQPGNCPVCGMKLKKVTIKEAEKNLKSHNFKVK